MQSPGFITEDPLSWENPPSLVRGNSRSLSGLRVGIQLGFGSRDEVTLAAQ